MPKGLLSGIAATVAVVTAAGAADLSRGPGYDPMAGPCGWCRWIGPYVGANLGFGWGTVSNSGAKPDGFAGGLEGGFNWQFGQLVVGWEADLQLSNSSDVFANYKFSNPWFGTIRGRGGVALENILFYGTLGLAYGRGHVDLGSLGESNFHVGWTAGAGLEVSLNRNWSLKAEYLFIDLASESYGLTLANNGFTSNLVRFGVNYRF
jgi:outer membrane immunogenic protein